MRASVLVAERAHGRVRLEPAGRVRPVGGPASGGAPCCSSTPRERPGRPTGTRPGGASRTRASRAKLRTTDSLGLGPLWLRARKSGFCLIDSWGLARRVRGIEPALPRFVGDCATLRPDALRVEQGSSVGYTDRYPAFFHGQDLELTGLRAGRYVLVQTANPERRLREVDYGNNAASLLLRLSWPSGRASPPRIQVLRTCGGAATCGQPG